MKLKKMMIPVIMNITAYNNLILIDLYIIYYFMYLLYITVYIIIYNLYVT